VVTQAPPEPPRVELAEVSPEANPADVRYHDANVDRVVLGSTAETQPKGTFFVSDYEILLLQVGYAITDSLQVSVSGVPPIVQGQPFFVDLGLKLNVARGKLFRAALTGAFDTVTSGSGSDSGPFFGGRLGAIGQLCFERNCRSSVSFNAGTLLTSGVNEALPVYGTAGFIVNVSLLFEPAMMGAVGAGSGMVSSGAVFAADYGVRLAGKNFGVDFTFIEPVATTMGSVDNPFYLGFPFVTFTYRTDGARPNE
jgi:hypothetical protein